MAADVRVTQVTRAQAASINLVALQHYVLDTKKVN